MGVEIRTGRQCVQSVIGRSEVKKAMGKLKIGKAAAIDGITGEMLRYGGLLSKLSFIK